MVGSRLYSHSIAEILVLCIPIWQDFFYVAFRIQLISRLGGTDMKSIDLRGLVPAPVTPFTRDGEVDHAAIQRYGSWLGSFKGVKGLVVLGHAGEGTFLTPDEQTAVIESFVKSVDGKIPVIAGITTEGTKVAALEAKRAVNAGAQRQHDRLGAAIGRCGEQLERAAARIAHHFSIRATT